MSGRGFRPTGDGCFTDTAPEKAGWDVARMGPDESLSPRERAPGPGGPRRFAGFPVLRQPAGRPARGLVVEEHRRDAKVSAAGLSGFPSRAASPASLFPYDRTGSMRQEGRAQASDTGRPPQGMVCSQLQHIHAPVPLPRWCLSLSREGRGCVSTNAAPDLVHPAAGPPRPSEPDRCPAPAGRGGPERALQRRTIDETGM